MHAASILNRWLCTCNQLAQHYAAKLSTCSERVRRLHVNRYHEGIHANDFAGAWPGRDVMMAC